MGRLAGIEIKEECQEKFNALNHGKYSYVIYRLNDSLDQIEVVKAVAEGGRAGLEAELADVSDSRYAVLDYEFTTDDGGQRKKLCFVSWCPEDTNKRRRMTHASSKDVLKRSLGLTVEVQATDISELSEEEFRSKFKNIS
ncbi:hypothetical protein THASP1DRAFT_27323 [Thamnocephalis sphaerospora]|uniref:Cofilin n=1 Tax=Thamnocephalis sphaerospora TaxID=78915 RepID=A0A4V1IXF7_9FUNG|nr:hypothetical protein THASP1DRAFT_27323 [Thamnocephalis sphaerospora]|eukprot:RKP10899.1 hypothetical protein THASP1DRAFT_27323 [Thamnocephalis sphaerospora]